MTQQSTIVNFLNEVAKQRGFSTYDIASRTGLDQAHVWRILNDKKTPRIDTLILIAEAIGVRINVSSDEYKDVMSESADIPKKLHFHISGREFVFFNGTPKMIIEVMSFDDQSSLLYAIDAYKNNTMFFGSSTEWDGKYYLLVAIEFPDGPPQLDTQTKAYKMARVMRRLADWYRYTVLASKSN